MVQYPRPYSHPTDTEKHLADRLPGDACRITGLRVDWILADHRWLDDPRGHS